MPDLPKPCRIILDVDTGIDDAMAILFAINRPGITLEALTTTYGNIDVASATRNSLQILEAAGCRDVPVAAGAARALTRPFSKRGSRIHGATALAMSNCPNPRPAPSIPGRLISSSNWCAPVLAS